MKIYFSKIINYDKFKKTNQNKKISFKCTPLKPDITVKGHKLDFLK